MKRRQFLKYSATACLGVGATACQQGPVHLQLPASLQTLTLKSNDFEAEKRMPAVLTCDGDNRSPGLRWSAPPAGTQGWVLICRDPDAPWQAFTHWLVYNLPASARGLAAGIAPEPELPNRARHGKNDFGELGYGGPCPPNQTHRYIFRLYAVDQRFALAPGASYAEVAKLLKGHVLAFGELMGTYTRQ